MRGVTEPSDLPFGTRLWFAWVCFLRVLFDGAFAGRAFAVREGMPSLTAAGRKKSGSEAAAPKEAGAPADEPSGDEDERPRASMDAPPLTPEGRRRMAKTVREARPLPVDASATREVGGLLLLSLLQREGRLVDFLRQDVASFSDEDIGAAARVVHAGCRKALDEHATIAVVQDAEENATVEVPVGYDPSSFKLVGNVKGEAPFTGKLRHRGWRAARLTLPDPVTGHDVRVLAPAEVEL